MTRRASVERVGKLEPRHRSGELGVKDAGVFLGGGLECQLLQSLRGSATTQGVCSDRNGSDTLGAGFAWLGGDSGRVEGD